MGESEFACLVEVLAKYRRHTEVADAVAQVVVSASDEDMYPTVTGGVLDSDWPEKRRLGTGTLRGRFCFVTHSESVAQLRQSFEHRYPGLVDTFEFTATLLKEAKRRDVTQRVARILYEFAQQDGEKLDGIHFISQHGDDLKMWTLFERSPDSLGRLVSSTDYREIASDRPALVEAMAYHGIRWAHDIN